MSHWGSYQPNETIVDRAVELWVRAINKPKFDNGGKDFGNFMAGQLAGMMADKHVPTEGQLAVFRMELKTLLMNEVSMEQLRDEPETEKSLRYFHTSLGVDYGADLILSCAAKRSSIHESLFPWKTNMSLSAGYVCFGVGYQSPWMYHYPLSDGRWLVTQLAGEDIGKVIEYVEGGKPEFDIEEASVVAQ